MSTRPSLAEESLVDVVRLIRTTNIGPITFFNLVRQQGSVKAALEALPDMARRGGRKSPLVPLSIIDAEQEIEKTEAYGARMIVYGADDYPKWLTYIPDPPPLISVLGSSQIWQEKESIAMVGARNASANGCHLAKKLARELGEHGFNIISGLARGIDSFAHQGSLSTGTIGVIAGGIDNIYPPENQMLYKQISETGCIISEQPFGNVPFAGAFPSRNRIIAGIALGTLVVEASPKSGSLITARLTGEYNREIFAIPGSPMDPRSKGCNRLLKQGATMVENASDIIETMTSMASQGLREPSPIQYNSDPEYDELPDEQSAVDIRNALLEKLSYSPIDIDMLIAQTGGKASDILPVLLELEIAGSLHRHAGNKVSLVAELNENIA